MIYVAVMGYGTVGGGVVEVLEKNKKEVAGKVGDEVGVKYILDLRDFPGDPYEDKLVKDYSVIVNDPSVSIVVEAMGGTGAAYKFTKEALLNGKSVCTSNKALVAQYGPELMRIAEENNCSYLFEASVGGGIPIIRPLRTCFTAEHIESITGILNGTTNYMLTKMNEEGCDYDDVLKEAQAKGYAEANPEADVCGYDACRKIAILSSICFNKTVHFEEIKTEGITKICSVDFAYAAELGKSIKLLGHSREVGDKCLAITAPFMIGPECPLYSVKDVFNGILVHGNMVDDVMFYGRGAGKLATASAVVADVVECAVNKGKNIQSAWEDGKCDMALDSDMQFKYFVRVKNDGLPELETNVKVNRIIKLKDFAEETGVVTEITDEASFGKTMDVMGDKVLNYIRMM